MPLQKSQLEIPHANIVEQDGGHYRPARQERRRLPETTNLAQERHAVDEVRARAVPDRQRVRFSKTP